MNCKKRGRCPYVNQEKYPDLVAGDPRDIPKRMCEEVFAEVEFESKYDEDLCHVLADDTVYELFKRDGQPFHIVDDIASYGPVGNFS